MFQRLPKLRLPTLDRDLILALSCCLVAGLMTPGHLAAVLAKYGPVAQAISGGLLLGVATWFLVAGRFLWNVLIRNELGRRLQRESPSLEQAAAMAALLSMAIAWTSDSRWLAAACAALGSALYVLLRAAHEPRALRKYIRQFSPSPVQRVESLERKPTWAALWLQPFVVAGASRGMRGDEADAFALTVWRHTGGQIAEQLAVWTLAPSIRSAFLASTEVLALWMLLAVASLLAVRSRLFNALLVKSDIDRRNGHLMSRGVFALVKSLPVLGAIAAFAASSLSIVAGAAFAVIYIALHLSHNLRRVEAYLDRLILIKG